MKNILTIDIGGTTVKSGLWNGQALERIDSVATPETWDEMKKLVSSLARKYTTVDGVAFSTPGSVNTQEGVIYGISAVPYIHNFPIRNELEKLLEKPVSIQNDANCAALAELWQGNAQNYREAAFLIIGSGLGGAVISDGKLKVGENLFGGEFGYQIIDYKNLHTLSELGSPVAMAKKYSERKNDGKKYSGEEVFQIAEKGEGLAIDLTEKLYNALSIGIYNILLSIDPEAVLIGGGISKRKGLIDELEKRVINLLKEKGAKDISYKLLSCRFLNNANLIGAANQLIIEKNDD